MRAIVVAAVAGIILGIFLMFLIYRAVSNLIDWVILTFGNDEAVHRLKLRRGSGDR
ncbi:MAG TPA: hypothetical protein VM573_00095 [Actinomycetota bacterium]|jgi:mannose/fructose/N-acetylgalactosamine-specific phosphotransferase system component IID|nr:hypothetical protein [Actinomycetota bacterium]